MKKLFKIRKQQYDVSGVISQNKQLQHYFIKCNCGQIHMNYEKCSWCGKIMDNIVINRENN